MVILEEEFKDYYSDLSNLYEKIKSEVNKNRITKIRRGVYSTNPYQDKLLLANRLIKNTYISFDFALYYYDLIPEQVYSITSASLNKKRKNAIIANHINYFYKDIKESVFYEGLTCFIDEFGNTIRIATKEKALCDKLSTIPQIRTIKELERLLFEDLKIDIDEFNKLNKNELIRLAKLYKKPTLNTFIKLLNNERVRFAFGY